MIVDNAFIDKMTVGEVPHSKLMEQNILDTNAGKLLSEAATDVLLTLVLKYELHLNMGLKL
jgi:hypothetical protein